MSHQPTETEPLLGARREEVAARAGPRQPILWILPVVALASICHGISMYTGYNYYQDIYCPDATYVCGAFSIWAIMPRFNVRVQIDAMFASFVVSFVSIGWWSAFGDRRGRRPVLFASVLGAMLLDLTYLIVRTIGPLRRNPRDSLSLGIIIQNLLGGFAAYNGAIHAYAFDTSPGPFFRTIAFCAMQALSFLSFRIGATVGWICGPMLSLAYILSIAIAICNLAFIHYILPESLVPGEAASATQTTTLKAILLPYSIFLRVRASRVRLAFFALAVYMYTLTSAMDVAMVVFAVNNRYFSLSSSALTIIQNITTVVTLACLLPVLASLYRSAYGDTRKSGFFFTKTLAQNSILTAALTLIGMLIFGGSGFLFKTFFFIYPFTVGALPALYSLAASLFVGLNRTAEIGTLFGALSLWGYLAQFVSHTWIGEFSSDSGAIFLGAFSLVVSVIFLVPDGPPVPLDESADEQVVEPGV